MTEKGDRNPRRLLELKGSFFIAGIGDFDPKFTLTASFSRFSSVDGACLKTTEDKRWKQFAGEMEGEREDPSAKFVHVVVRYGMERR